MPTIAMGILLGLSGGWTAPFVPFVPLEWTGLWLLVFPAPLEAPFVGVLLFLAEALFRSWANWLLMSGIAEGAIVLD